MFREMEAVCSAVTTIGSSFERAVVCSVGLVDTYTALSAEITGGGVRHF